MGEEVSPRAATVARVAVVIAGPTAVGKTDLAIDIAARFPCDVISVDSALVYRGMDIGTAKPDAATLAKTPHALIDIRDPDERYSAGEFQRDAWALMEASWARGRLPLLVGGTLLYLRALNGGLAELPAADPALRQTIDAAAADKGWPALHAELAAVDPASAARIEPADAQRIQRALEVYRLTGQTLSHLHATAARDRPDWQPLAYGLMPAERTVLHNRIEQRFAAMLEAGFVTEVERLDARYGLSADTPSMRAVGYRQLLAHVRGQTSLAAAVAAGKAATRQLAKRQITWLRHDPLYTHLEPDRPAAAARISAAIEVAWR